MHEPRAQLLVSPHDVSPLTLEACRTAIDLLGNAGIPPPALTVLVVAFHDARIALDEHPPTVELLQALAQQGATLVAHGYTHRMVGRPRTPATKQAAHWFAHSEGEFAACSAAETERRLALADAIFARARSRAAHGRLRSACVAAVARCRGRRRGTPLRVPRTVRRNHPCTRRLGSSVNRLGLAHRDGGHRNDSVGEAAIAACTSGHPCRSASTGCAVPHHAAFADPNGSPARIAARASVLCHFSWVSAQRVRCGHIHPESARVNHGPGLRSVNHPDPSRAPPRPRARLGESQFRITFNDRRSAGLRRPTHQYVELSTDEFAISRLETLIRASDLNGVARALGVAISLKQLAIAAQPAAYRRCATATESSSPRGLG